MGYTFFIQLYNIAGDQAIPSTANAITFQAMIQGSTYDRTDAWVHTGCIATAGKYTDSLYAH